jgi:hypothetical protein
MPSPIFGEHDPSTGVDRCLEDLVVADQRHPHRFEVVLPERSRALEVGEECEWEAINRNADRRGGMIITSNLSADPDQAQGNSQTPAQVSSQVPIARRFQAPTMRWPFHLCRVLGTHKQDAGAPERDCHTSCRRWPSTATYRQASAAIGYSRHTLLPRQRFSIGILAPVRMMN